MSKLYPPHIEGVLPAFYYSAGDSNVHIRVPFALNRAVGKKEIKGFALKVKNITANTYILQTTQMKTNKFSLNENPYVIFDVDRTSFKQGQHYKIQIAFINEKSEAGYYSSVGTIKCAGQPTVTITGLIDNQDNSHQYTYTGVYTQPIEDASEKLYKSRFVLTNANTGVIVQDSGFIMHNTLNDAAGSSATENFTFTKALQPKVTYNLVYQTVSVNGLQVNSKTYRIVDKNDSVLVLPVTLQAYADTDDGYIDVFFRAKPGQTNPVLTGYYVLSRRASNKPDEWIQITTFTMNNTKAVRHLYRDFNIEQGITYTYAVQKQNDTTGSGSLVLTSRVTSNDCKSIFSDCFLSDGTRQLKIRFNAQVSTFRKTILENKNETIGGKYPFIFRNGHVNYRELSLGGLISYQMDENDKFINRKSFLGLEYAILDQSQDNIAAERKFKREVEDWLTDGQVKLFRSPTEGNYIVRLMNVSLSPETGINRMLHSFSCSAYEIDDYTIAALRKHGLLFTQAVTDFIDIELERIKWDGGVSGTLPPDRASSKGFPATQSNSSARIAAVPAMAAELTYADFPLDEDDSSVMLLDESINTNPTQVSKGGGIIIRDQRLTTSTQSHFSTTILPSGFDEVDALTKVVTIPFYGKDEEFNRIVSVIPSYIDANVSLSILPYQYSRIINSDTDLKDCFNYNPNNKSYELKTSAEKDNMADYKNNFLALVNKYTYIGGSDSITLNGDSKIFQLEIVDAVPGTRFMLDGDMFLITKTGSFYSEFEDGIESFSLLDISNTGLVTYVCADDAASVFSNVTNVITEDVACEQFIGKPYKVVVNGLGQTSITNNLIEAIENVKNTINSIKRISIKKRPVELLYRKNNLNYIDMECTQVYQNYNPLAVYAVCKPRETYEYDKILFSQYLTDAFLKQGYYVDNEGNKISIFTGSYLDGRVLSGEIESGDRVLNFSDTILINGELIKIPSSGEYELIFNNEDTLFDNITYGDSLYCEISYKKDVKEYSIEDADISVRAAKLQYLVAIEALSQHLNTPPAQLTESSAKDYNNTLKALQLDAQRKYDSFIQILTIVLKEKEG